MGGALATGLLSVLVDVEVTAFETIDAAELGVTMLGLLVKAVEADDTFVAFV